jgi:hypothetical protein
MKLKKIKKITASVIGISTIGWSISSVIQPNDEEQIKALSAKTDSQDKVDINDLFNEFNIPITVQASPDKNNLIECIKLANPKLNNLI